MSCGKGQWSVPSPGTHRRAIRHLDKLWLAASGHAEVSGSREEFRGLVAVRGNIRFIQKERCQDGSVSQLVPIGPGNGGYN